MRYIEQTIELEAAIRDLHHPKSRVRLQAAGALGSAAEPEAASRAAQALLPLLEDRVPEVRAVASRSLGNLESSRYVEALIERLKQDPSWQVRQEAAAALGKIGDSRATQPLIDALGSDSADIRFQATAALSLVNPQVAPQHLRRLLTDPDAEIRASAVAALGDLNDHQSLPVIKEMLADPQATVRLEAAVTLTRLGTGDGAAILTDFLKHKDFRQLAAENLFLCPAAESIPALVTTVTSWRTPAEVKVWLAGALAKFGHPLGPKMLLKMIQSKKPTVRGLSIQILGALKQPWSLQALETLAQTTTKQWHDGRRDVVPAKKLQDLD